MSKLRVENINDRLMVQCPREVDKNGVEDETTMVDSERECFSCYFNSYCLAIEVACRWTKDKQKYLDGESKPT